jgi:hypothetical protein
MYFPNKIAAVTVMIFKSVYSDQQIVEKYQKYLLPSHMLESQFSTSDFWNIQLIVGTMIWIGLFDLHIHAFHPPTCQPVITLVNKDFVPWRKMSVSDVFLDAEFKYVSRISLSPIPFAPG